MEFSQLCKIYWIYLTLEGKEDILGLGCFVFWVSFVVVFFFNIEAEEGSILYC